MPRQVGNLLRVLRTELAVCAEAGLGGQCRRARITHPQLPGDLDHHAVAESSIAEELGRAGGAERGGTEHVSAIALADHGAGGRGDISGRTRRRGPPATYELAAARIESAA